MSRRQFTAVFASLLILTACATAPPMDRDALTIAPVSGQNKEINVSLTQTLLPGDAGYIPTNKNWVQHQLTVRSNSRPLTISMIALVDQGGKLHKPAMSGSELSEEPNFTKHAGKQTLISTGSMLASFVVPFAGVLGSAATVADMTTDADDRFAKVKIFNDVSVVRTSLEAGGATDGSVFFPPLKKPKALLLTYKVGKNDKRIRIAIPQ